MKPIVVLSIYPGHNSTAALLKDGRILGIVSEERFTRIKNQGGFPKQSIKWLMEEFKIKKEDITRVAVCGSKLIMSSYDLQKDSSAAKKSLQASLSKLYGKAEFNSGKLYKPIYKIKEFLIDKDIDRKLNSSMLTSIKKELKISEDKIEFVEHHNCHAYAGYYGLSEEKEKALILTLDGEGDDVCASVSIAEGYAMKRIASTFKYHSLGYIYSLTTAFMGMTALEHEYKVMGLAPYASSKEQKYFLKTYNKVFKDVIWLSKKNPLVFESKFPTNRFLLWLHEKAVGERFDNLAGALQHLTEELVKEWVRNAIKKTKINNVYCSGGVFMNVKMNMVLAQMPEVKNIHVMPSGGDESNPIGAAYFCYIKECEKLKQTPKTFRIRDLYLGPDLDSEAEKYIKKKKLEKKYHIQNATPEAVASLLAKGEVVARCAGKMEWGARSLGNRCIMANPSDLKYVWEINEQIKMRDFWMPFAPSIVKERENDYIVNPKHLDAPYMILAFKSTPLGQKELRGAMHQADFTLRPQLVKRNWNERYYDIIKAFESITGIGGVLNTSFNLHGKPIVMTPKDAVEEVFEHSGLKHLVLGNFLISKHQT